MPFPILPVLGGVLAGSLLTGGMKQKEAKPRQISTLTPEQQRISRLMQQQIIARQGFGRGLEKPAMGALQGILGGGAYRGLATPGPQFAATYGRMGLQAVQQANQAILAREAQRLQAVPAAQQIWQEPYRMGIDYLRTPMVSTYLEQPGPTPLAQLLGLAAPIIGGGLAGGYF